MYIQWKSEKRWALIKNKNNEIIGLWISEIATANNIMRLRTIISMEAALGENINTEHYAAVAQGEFQLCENNISDDGGFTLFFK